MEMVATGNCDAGRVVAVIEPGRDSDKNVVATGLNEGVAGTINSIDCKTGPGGTAVAESEGEGNMGAAGRSTDEVVGGKMGGGILVADEEKPVDKESAEAACRSDEVEDVDADEINEEEADVAEEGRNMRLEGAVCFWS